MFIVIALAAAVILALGGGAKPAHAATTINVTTTNDEVLTNPADTSCVSASGCSLRAALMVADNLGAGTTTINLPAGAYNLSASLGALQVGKGAGEIVQLVGAGAPTVRQAPLCTEPAVNCMVFFVDPSGGGGVTVSISGLTITGGHSDLGGGGILAGSITTTPDQLAVSNSTITGNRASGGASGGGISFARGTLTIDNVDFESNQAIGGGNGGGVDFADLSGASTLTVTNSIFDLNTSDATLNGGGGAIHTVGANSTYTITRTLFNGNNALDATAPGGGGAILKDSGSLTVTGSNFVLNSSGPVGAGGAVNSSSDNSDLGHVGTPGLNRFAGNTAVAAGGQSIFRNTGNLGVVTAEDNWWGSNTPNVSDAARNVPLADWFELRLSASPVFVLPAGATALTADLSHTHTNATPGIISMISLSIPVTWPAATLGSISAADTQLNGSAQAAATYTADGATGTGTASVRVDGQTVTLTSRFWLPSRSARLSAPPQFRSTGPRA